MPQANLTRGNSITEALHDFIIEQEKEFERAADDPEHFYKYYWAVEGSNIKDKFTPNLSIQPLINNV